MSGAGPIVHVIAPSPAGGAETVVAALAAAAPDRVRVIVLNQTGVGDSPALPLVQLLRRRSVAVEEVRCGRRQYRAEVDAVERYLRECRATLVHTHGYHGTWVGFHAARRLRLPTVATVHGYLTRSLKERFYNLVDRRLLRRFDRVIAVSQGIRDQLIRSGIPAERVDVVQNGLTGTPRTTPRARARELLGVPSDAKVAGWIGRLSPEKGADLFLRALARNAESCGVVVGDGPEMANLVALSRELGLDDSSRVRLAGFHADAGELLPAFDVLALTSRMEGTPMVILESVAMGVPVVSFAVGGIPELLDDECAWLVPPGDVAAFADALFGALQSPTERQRRAANARRRLSDRLSIEQWTARVSAVYDRAMQGA